MILKRKRKHPLIDYSGRVKFIRTATIRALAITLAAFAVLSVLAVMPVQATDSDTNPNTHPAVEQSATRKISPTDERVTEILAGLTIEQKIGQILWTHVYGTSAEDTTYASASQTVFGEDVSTPAQAVAKYHLGGVVYYTLSKNVENPSQLASMSAGLQTANPHPELPLALAMDQEGGLVARLRVGATDLPDAMAVGAAGDTQFSYQVGTILARELSAVGVNVDLAPDADVNTTAANPVIGMRSFGDDPVTVGQMVAAQVRGLQETTGHVGAMAKHFPGHGDTHNDSHSALPRVSYDRATLQQHLIPFQAAMDAGVDMIMTAHIIVDAIDSQNPATMSAPVLKGLLREEMGYQGLIVSDALDMEGAELSVLDERKQQEYLAHKAELAAALAAVGNDPVRAMQVAANPTPEYKAFMAPIRGEVALRTLKAGADVLLKTYDPQAVVTRITSALASGELPAERLDDAVRRVVAWKLTRLLGAQPLPLSEVGSQQNAAVADAIAGQAVTLLRNAPLSRSDTGGSDMASGTVRQWLAGDPALRTTEPGLFPAQGFLPLDSAEQERFRSVYVVGPDYANPEFLEQELKRRNFDVQRTSFVGTNPTDDEAVEAREKAAAASIVMFTSLNMKADSGQAKLLRDLVRTSGKPVLLFSARTPYDLANYASTEGVTAQDLPLAALAPYSNRLVMYRAAVNTLLGAAPRGRLPVRVPFTGGLVAEGDLAFARGFGLTYAAVQPGGEEASDTIAQRGDTVEGNSAIASGVTQEDALANTGTSAFLPALAAALLLLAGAALLLQQFTRRTV